ncbi:MAG TPA: CvpA family protein [Thermomicrobiales bacterium]|nr:CvpA family protein [Thermomicrobiales bacterium]
MNVLDFGIVLVFAILIMVGFFGGVGRVTAGFFAVYFASIVSAAFYEGLGDIFIDRVSDMREATAYLLSFMLLFVSLSGAFFWAIGATIKAVELRRGRFAIMDNVGGATMALVVGAVAVAMTLSVSVIILGAFNQSAVVNGDENLGTLGKQIRGSELVPMFLKLQEPILVVYRPWFPEGLPPILKTPPQSVT